MQKKKASADELIALILEGIEDVKGVDINLLDLREIENTVCDYFIICCAGFSVADVFHNIVCEQYSFLWNYTDTISYFRRVGMPNIYTVNSD